MNNKLFLATKIGLFLVFLIIFQVVIKYAYVERIFINQESKYLNSLADRIKSDLVYKNGILDTSRYNSDPQTPYPHGSSGFSLPLYIITSDGFIIERNQPINGFLDSSDFKQMLPFQNPQTINSVTNENWRIMTKAIKYNNENIGVIIVSYYNPDQKLLGEIDLKLKYNLDAIFQKIKINNKIIDINKIDIRNIHYDVSFEIVDNFNKVLINNGRLPVFIDRSYVYQALQDKDERIINDQIIKERYLIVKRTIYDKRTPVAIVLVGKSIGLLKKGLKAFLVLDLIVLIVFFVIIFLLIKYFLKKDFAILFWNNFENINNKNPKKISFDKKESYLSIDNKKIKIPYASNQYYLCEALFSNPLKRWEQDELLEKFGEDTNPEGWRKVYDSMLAINKKIFFKLIIYEDRTYRINPQYSKNI
jgi:hypothetical protein